MEGQEGDCDRELDLNLDAQIFRTTHEDERKVYMRRDWQVPR